MAKLESITLPGLLTALDQLSFTFNHRDTTCLFCNTNFGSGFTYFEVDVVNCSENSIITIGLVGNRSYRHNRQPGWDSGSIGYHGDDGKLFSGSGIGSPFARTWVTRGDTAGCGFDPISGRIFFTRNGELVGTKVSPPFHGADTAVPTVGMRCPDGRPISANVNFGQRPFRFRPAGGDNHVPAPGPSSRSALRCFEPTTLVSQSADRLSLTYGTNETCCVLADGPLDPPSFTYFEVTVVECDPASGIATLGLVSSRAYSRGRQPGWDSGSIGYHGDDGKMFPGGSVIGDTWARAGCVAGCGFDPSQQRVYFTLNGRLVHSVIMPSAAAMTPAVGLRASARTVSVKANFGQQQFVYKHSAAALPSPSVSAVVDHASCHTELNRLQEQLAAERTKAVSLQTEIATLRMERARVGGGGGSGGGVCIPSDLSPLTDNELTELEGRLSESLLSVRKEAQQRKVCVVCLERNRTTLLLPCKHLCLCGECAGALKAGQCPLCRQPIVDKIQVYN